MLPLKRCIKRLLYKKITCKNNLILLDSFNMTLVNKDRKTCNKNFCKSQKELMSLITKFDQEDLWRRQNPNTHWYMHFHGRSNTCFRTDRVYRRTNLRVGVKIDHKINTCSDHFQTIMIKREPTNFKRAKDCWILLDHFRSIWEWW